MKTLYHGTIMEYAEKIQREGLQPKPEQAVMAKMTFMPYSFEELRAEDCSRYTYDGYRDYGDGTNRCDTVNPHVVKERSFAEKFARWRKSYTETNAGEHIKNSDWYSSKTGGEPARPAQAALVTLEVPNNWPLIPDYQLIDVGWVSPKPIPAKYIKSIEPVE